MDRLKGIVCIVTGAAQGIGRAITELFAREGAKMVFASDMKEAAFDQPNIRFSVMNTTDGAAVTAMVDGIWKEFGQLDVIVNNAGITRDALCTKMTEEQWDLVLDVNLKAPHRMIAAAGPYLMEQGTGSIINLSSVVGLYGNIGQANYAATKAGVIALCKTWTKELSRKGAKIRANAIAPGFIKTPMVDTIPEKVIQEMCNAILFREMGTPEDVANLALFLASDESKFITGQVIEVAGGAVM